jgi:hypothetical protein
MENPNTTEIKMTKGFKVTDAEMQCRGYQYELGKKFKHEGSISLCGSGFHFCINPADCFRYYNFESTNRVFEVVAYGDLRSDDDKSVTAEIEFIREIPWMEVLTIVNSGKENTGLSNSGDRNSGDSNSGDRNSGDRNSGDWNSGDWNSGDRNSGDSNSGYRNSGDRNSGDRNSGDRNSGDWNSGDWNSGDRNSGDSNSGYRNSGDRNSGDSNSGDRNSGNRNSGDSNSGYRNSGNWNSGDRNSGDRNSGDRNSGDWNSGNRNSGDSNSGYRNSGNWNSGNRNSGDSNSGYRNSGAFCTDEDPQVILFDKPTKMTVKEWEQTRACQLMYNIDPTVWVPWSIMTEEERKRNPKYEASEGYTKSIPMTEAWANFWGNLPDEDKQLFLDLPNFDAEKFKKITGIKVK